MSPARLPDDEILRVPFRPRRDSKASREPAGRPPVAPGQEARDEPTPVTARNPRESPPEAIRQDTEEER